LNSEVESLLEAFRLPANEERQKLKDVGEEFRSSL
jgi:hypothetical protein